MEIKRVIVDGVPVCCMGKADKEDNKYYPNPCEAMMVSDPLWCMFTGDSIEDGNDPHVNRPKWCPLITERDAIMFLTGL